MMEVKIVHLVKVHCQVKAFVRHLLQAVVVRLRAVEEVH